MTINIVLHSNLSSRFVDFLATPVAKGAIMFMSEIWNAYVQSPMWSRESTEKRRNAVRDVFQAFAMSCKGLESSRLTSRHVAEWLDIETVGKSNKTYNEHLRCIRQVLKGVLSLTGLTVNPALEVPAKRKRSISRKPLTQEEVERVLSNIETGITIPYKYKTHGKVVVVERPYEIPYKEEVRLAIILGAWHGLRLGDAVAVERNMYDGEFLHYKPQKTLYSSGKEVSVPVVDNRLKTALEACDGLLTPNLLKWHGHNASTLTRLFKRIFEYSGLVTQEKCEGRRNASIHGFHSLRHSYVTWCCERGVSLDVIKDCVGHASTITTTIYAHVSAQRKARELARIMQNDR